MTHEEDIQELKHRTVNGLLAGAGAFAITALSCYRVSQEMYYEPDFGKVTRLSGIVAGVAGLAWFLMPAARQHPQEHMEEIKNTITGPVKVLLNQVLVSQKNAATEMQQARAKYYNSLNSVQSTGWVPVGTLRDNPTSSYERGFRKVSIFDNSFTQDFPPIDDDDLADFYSGLDDTP